MTVESIVLVASVLTIFAFGVLMGYRLSKGRVAARAKRQEAAQRFMYRQLHELQTARRKGYPARRIDVRSFS